MEHLFVGFGDTFQMGSLVFFTVSDFGHPDNGKLSVEDVINFCMILDSCM